MITFAKFFDGLQESVALGDLAPDTVEFRELAVELIDEFLPNTNAIWRQVNDNESDPDTPWDTRTGGVSNHDVKIIFTRDNLENRQLLRYLTDTEIPEGTLNGIMYPYNFEPRLKDTVVRNNIEYNVNAVDPIAPLDGVILYTFELAL